MKILTRNHNMENAFNYVKMCKKFCYMSTEKQLKPTKVLVTEKIRNAFNDSDWNYLEQVFIAQF